MLREPCAHHYHRLCPNLPLPSPSKWQSYLPRHSGQIPGGHPQRTPGRSQFLDELLYKHRYPTPGTLLTRRSSPSPTPSPQDRTSRPSARPSLSSSAQPSRGSLWAQLLCPAQLWGKLKAQARAVSSSHPWSCPQPQAPQGEVGGGSREGTVGVSRAGRCTQPSLPTEERKVRIGLRFQSTLTSMAKASKSCFPERMAHLSRDKTRSHWFRNPSSACLFWAISQAHPPGICFWVDLLGALALYFLASLPNSTDTPTSALHHSNLQVI